MAQLVIADAAFKVYPGGVIVLRASDWLGAARGTLTTEVDALAPTATVVRDAQQVATSIFSNANGAFQEADDTFVIDFADLPVIAGIRYNPFVLARLEGDWDPTNADTLRTADQTHFAHACDLRWYGDSTNFLSDTDTSVIVNKPRGAPQWRVLGFGTVTGIGTVGGSEVLRWRAYSQNGTTIEWLISQIYLVPSGSAAGTQTVQGAIPDVLLPAVDGADGGDANGKFTVHPTNNEREQTAFFTDDGGGDYQQKADVDDAEYYAQVTALDGGFLADPESMACYAVHGPFHLPATVWADDEFTRTIGDNDFDGADNHFVDVGWGDTPEGFGWCPTNVMGASLPEGPQTAVSGSEIGFRVGKALWVTGTEGGMDIRTPATANLASILFPQTATANIDKARVRADNLIFSGKFRAEMNAAFSADGTRTASCIVATGPNNLNWVNSMGIIFNLKAGTWVVHWSPNGTLQAGPFTLTGWTPGTGARFKMEIRRYLYRVKVWNEGSSEPGTWDHEEFRPIFHSFVLSDYPYGDDLEIAFDEIENHTVFVAHSSNARSSDAKLCQFYFDDLTLEHDPGGDEEPASASIEAPEGTQRGEIEIPAGCQHLVFWGTRTWAVDDGFGDTAIEFSAKLWNDPTAAELQRSEALWWHFIPAVPGIVSMNWRSADRSDVKRVLVGAG